MKRVLEDELISLAHRILKLKNRADIHQLKKEAGMLYEKLAVLSFAEKHFGGIRPTIGKKEFTEAYYSQYSDIDEDGSYNSPDGTEYNPEAISEPNTEKIKDIVSHMPPEAEQVDYLISQFKKLTTDDFNAAETAVKNHQQETEAPEQQEENTRSQEETQQEEDPKDEEVSEELPQENIPDESLKADEAEQSLKDKLDDLKSTPEEEELPQENTTEDLQNETPKPGSYEEDFGVHFDDLPDFEPKMEDRQENAPLASEEPKTTKEPEPTKTETPSQDQEYTQAENIDQQQPKRTIDLFSQEKKSLNDQLQRGIQIGLNDRLAFTKALFENNVEDYNRVMSQISTLNSFAEAEDFINYNVKPEYQNWNDKPEVYKRFLSLLKRKFEA
ncbi:MAG: hypothetical protein L0J45_00105 [Psychroflexus sp.]|nr:hypothetical protein [Psychroflexus sp.]MDN6310612.1 hypothetical protein [Psychroflexus sp.]